MSTAPRWACFAPALYSSKPGINRLLRSMGFQQLFDLREEAFAKDEEAHEIPAVETSEDAVKEKVIEAHRVLMGLSEENRVRFEDLMLALERGQG